MENSGEIVDLGVKLAVKAKLLFKKILEFKRNGVPRNALVATTANAGFPSSPSHNQVQLQQGSSSPQPRTTSSLPSTPMHVGEVHVSATSAETTSPSTTSGVPTFPLTHTDEICIEFPVNISSESIGVESPDHSMPQRVDPSPIESSLIEVSFEKAIL